MEAVIKTGGKQYLIKEGDKIQIEKTSHEVGTEIGFDQVLYISCLLYTSDAADE